MFVFFSSGFGEKFFVFSSVGQDAFEVFVDGEGEDADCVEVFGVGGGGCGENKKEEK